MGTDWYRPIADEESEIGILRLNWITVNQMLDRREAAEEQLEIAKLHGFWTNPQWFFAVGKDMDKRDSEEVMRIGKMTIMRQNNFDKKLEAAAAGNPEKEDRDDVAAKVRSARARRAGGRGTDEVDEALIADEVPRR